MPVTINGTSGINTPGVVNTAAETIATTLAVTGVTTVQAGTAALPAITTTGDTNTGIFFPAADTIAFAEGGVEAMRINSSGNVGIGTSSPAFKLTVVGGATSLAADEYTNIGAAKFASGNGSTNNYLFTGSTALDFHNAADSANLMRLTDGGNVGIGTSSPNTPLQVNGTIKSFASGVSNSNLLLRNSTTGDALGFQIQQDGVNNFIVNGSNGFMVFSTNNTERMRIDSSGGLILAGSTAQKATGTTWSNPSDQRLKDNIRDYEKGIDELMQVRVREWEYNGKGGTVEGTKGMGVVADEVMVVLPDTVENYEAKLNADDEEVTAIKKFDATEITWLLVKTVQEQQALITALTIRITALEAI